MNTDELNAKLAAAQSLLNEVRDALNPSPAPPVEPTTPPPTVEPHPLPVPVLTHNGDGTVTASGASGLNVVAYCYEAQTNGWVANGQGSEGEPYTFGLAIAGSTCVKAAYFRFGPGGETLEQSEETILEL